MNLCVVFNGTLSPGLVEAASVPQGGGYFFPTVPLNFPCFAVLKRVPNYVTLHLNKLLFFLSRNLVYKTQNLKKKEGICKDEIPRTKLTCKITHDQ